jgi:hypothetical protein
MIEPFRIEVSPETIKDLRDRLRATRWPSGVSDEGGVPLTNTRAYDVVLTLSLEIRQHDEVASPERLRTVALRMCE